MIFVYRLARSMVALGGHMSQLGGRTTGVHPEMIRGCVRVQILGLGAQPWLMDDQWVRLLAVACRLLCRPLWYRPQRLGVGQLRLLSRLWFREQTRLWLLIPGQ